MDPRSSAPLLALVLACVALPRAGAAAPEDRSMRLTPAPDHPFVHGPATTDVATLERWLALQREDGRPLVVRLPVEVTLAVAGSTVGAARLVTGSTAGPALLLDDSALGVSLADRVRQACPGAAPCRLWLEGRWTPGHLAVTRARGALSPPESAAPLFAGLELPGARPDLVAAVDRLASSAPMATKYEAGRTLVAAGLDAAPLLVASLDDGRSYERRDIANRMNLPIHATVEPLLATQSVGSRCAELLHDLVTPAAGSPPAGNFKVYSQQILAVKDWRAFFAGRKGQSLAQIHAELLPLVNGYWEQHGTTQPVP